MAQPLPRFSRRFLQQSSPFQSLPRTRSFRPQFHANAKSTRGYSTGGPSKSPLKIWPFVAITLVGSGAYAMMVRSRAGTDMAPPTPQLPSPPKPTPTFSPEKVTILFVLGGPGAGKGTQCANLVRDYNFTHLSAGDLLRAEQERPGSEFGEMIKDYIKNGLIVPMEVTVQLLENAMTEVISKSPTGTGKFLIDGFPRKLDQAHKFEDTVCKGRYVLFYDCPEAEMQRRLMERGKTSGRTDDNAESIQKRFKVFIETSMPVVDYFDKQGRVIKLDATKTPEGVYEETRKKLEEKLGKTF
ncbi:uncharacterized protein EAE97_003061 [Botrytis byssoidea]|uniref:Uridylate kinase n=1 Tax=Botrytis byssoidea TaxID=139641 RepID=A0A9P5IPP8_9HELO|nr:uncharacterized protein EAE97_003061 [Botrytis byssoidea]KAF7949552.1 hypothetical protein EAE97_003061 [Botrytis byssoidea]